MTPIEKAKEIFKKFSVLTDEYPIDLDDNIEYMYLPASFVKEAALIAVNEVIAANPHSNPFNTNVESTMKWWYDVKSELEKLNINSLKNK